MQNFSITAYVVLKLRGRAYLSPPCRICFPNTPGRIGLNLFKVRKLTSEQWYFSDFEQVIAHCDVKDTASSYQYIVNPSLVNYTPLIFIIMGQYNEICAISGCHI